MCDMHGIFLRDFSRDIVVMKDFLMEDVALFAIGIIELRHRDESIVDEVCWLSWSWAVENKLREQVQLQATDIRLEVMMKAMTCRCGMGST
jgi:hypothetical protein